MALVDNLRIYGDGVGPFLASGEQLRWVMPFQLPQGARRLERTPEDVERELRWAPRRVRERLRAIELGTRPPPQKWRFERFLDGLFLKVTWPWAKVDWEVKIWGVTAAGHAGSVAYRLARLDEDHHSLFAAVTEQRLLVLDQTDSDRFELLLETPRESVVSAELHGRPLHRGRVVLTFADGSQLAIMAGIISTSAARRFVSSLVANR